jgi:hypothetical protein
MRARALSTFGGHGQSEDGGHGQSEDIYILNNLYINIYIYI